MEKENNNSNISAGTLIASIIIGSILGIFILYVSIGWSFIDGVPLWLNILAAIIGSICVLAKFSMQDEEKKAKEEQIQREKEQIELLKELNKK